MSEDPRYEVDDDEMKATLYRIASLIARAIEDANEASGKKMGFGLFLFDFGKGGSFFWMSNAQRQDMMKVLQEFMARERAH